MRQHPIRDPFVPVVRCAADLLAVVSEAAAPVVVETPAEGQAADIAWLRAHAA